MKQLMTEKLAFLSELCQSFSLSGDIFTSQPETIKLNTSIPIKTENHCVTKIASSQLSVPQDGTLENEAFRTTVNTSIASSKKTNTATNARSATQFYSTPSSFLFSSMPLSKVSLQPDRAGVNSFIITSYFYPIDKIRVDFAFLERFFEIKNPILLSVIAYMPPAIDNASGENDSPDDVTFLISFIDDFMFYLRLAMWKKRNEAARFSCSIHSAQQKSKTKKTIYRHINE